MSASIAIRLADELGTSLSRARKYVDEMGQPTAARVADEAAQVGDEGISGWTKAGLGAGAIGGGALVWREQDVRQARAIADQTKNYNEAITGVMESDLPPEVKRRLVVEASDAATDGGGGGDGGDDSGASPGGIIPQDPQTLIILIVVMALVLKFALEGDD